MNVLITGAQGLIGRHLADAMAPAHAVWALSRTPASHTHARHVVGDLSSTGFVDQLPEGIDTVFHLAQSRHHAAFPEHALDLFRVNVAATAALLDWARRTGVRRFVLASAGGAGDDRNDGPLSYYLGTKRSAEILAAAYRDHFHVIALRFHFVYGKGQQRSKLVPRLVDAVKAGTPITLNGADGIRLMPTHVDDAVAALTAAATLEGAHTIDVAGPDVLSMRAIGECIGRKVGREPVFTIVPAGSSHDVIADLSRMRALLGAPRRTLTDGVADVLV
jgi:UDP-glucose 4-epimerase